MQNFDAPLGGLRLARTRQVAGKCGALGIAAAKSASADQRGYAAPIPQHQFMLGGRSVGSRHTGRQQVAAQTAGVHFGGAKSCHLKKRLIGVADTIVAPEYRRDEIVLEQAPKTLIA